MVGLSPLVMTIFSAITLSLGIPNEFLSNGSALIGLVSLMPFYLAIKRSRSYLHAGFLGGIMMMLVHLISSFWLAYFKEFAIFTLGASSLALFVMGFLVGWLLRYALAYPEHLRPFLFAAVWTVWEWFKSIGFLAYPWGTLVMTSRDFAPLIQIADITGTWGISFLFSLVSALFAETVIHLPLLRGGTFKHSTLFRTTCFSALLMALACAYGSARLIAPPKPETSLDLVLVQQNADPWEEDGVKKSILSSEKLTRAALAKAEKKADLVVWSESVLAWPYIENRGYYRRISQEDPFEGFLAEIGAPLLVGSPVVVDPENDGMANSVILIGPDGEQIDYHAKVQLVPFAEYMPFTEYEIVRDFFDGLVGFSRGWIPGTSVNPMSVTNKEGTTVRFAAPICFEDAFPALNAQMHRAGSDILINLTNDSWSRTDSAELQHFVISSFRAIELRTTLVRSTNAGYTVVVDATGKVLRDLPLFEKTATFVSVPVYPHLMTFYARFGDWFPALITLSLMAMAFISYILDRIRQNR